MIIDMENRTRLQRVLEEHLTATREGESRKLLLIMLSLIYDLEEMESRRRQQGLADSSGLPDTAAHHNILEENRRLKALLDTLLSRVRFAPSEASETAH
jgi:hypothetical protein